jgi:hypothetical protein
MVEGAQATVTEEIEGDTGDWVAVASCDTASTSTPSAGRRGK